MADGQENRVPETIPFKHRVVLAAEAVAYVEKGGTNDFHKYNYLKEADVKREVSKALRAYGIILRAVDFTLLSDPNQIATATVQVDVRIEDAHSAEQLSSTAVGVGTDKGDKAVYKAMAGGLKYALTSLFLIATEDDPEGDPDTDKRSAQPKRNQHDGSDEKPASKTQNDNAAQAVPKDPGSFAKTLAAINAAETLDELKALKQYISKYTQHADFKSQMKPACEAKLKAFGG